MKVIIVYLDIDTSDLLLVRVGVRVSMSASTESCYYLSKRGGEKCKFNKTTQGPCKLTIEYCKKDADMYHKLCDRYWDITDEQISGMTEDEITKAVEELEVCLYMR